MVEQDLQLLDKKRLPRHIAIIMDGNGRWAERRGLPRIEGHRAGIETVRKVVRACGELEIEVLTLYTFSFENWSRPRDEVLALMDLFKKVIKESLNELNKHGVRLMAIGRLNELPDGVKRELDKAIRITSGNNGLILNLALSYSGRGEIVDGVYRLVKDVLSGKCRIEEINEELFSKYLYNNQLPDPDLLIRTSGELRVSNFLLWQIAYTEIWVSSLLWPDFETKDLYSALLDYQRRERRFGRVSKIDGATLLPNNK